MAAPLDPVDREIGNTDWQRMGKALLVVLGGEENGDRQPSSDETVERAYVMSRLAQLAKSMERPMSPQFLLDARVRRRFLEGLMGAALPDKDEASRTAVIDVLAQALGSDDAPGAAGLLPLEHMARRLVAAAKAADAVREDLDDQETVVVLRLLTLLQQGFGRSVNRSTSSTEESLVASVQKDLITRLEIDAADHDALLAPVRRFVAAHREVWAALTEQYGIDAHELVLEEEKARESLGDVGSRRARLDASLRFARIQAAMERQIHDDMPTAVQERMQVANIYWFMVRVSGK